MRIRKRFPPPSTTSDLHLSRSAAAQPKSEAAQTTDPLGQPSDKVMVISDSNTRWAQPEDDNNGVKTKNLKESGDDETWREEQKKNSAGDDIRENNIPYEEECTNNTFMQPSSSAAAAAKGDTKALVPLKKRRGSFERSPKKETQICARMKSKTNKKCDLSTQTGQEDAQNINISSSGNGTKKSKRGNVIMEGSRCSRVNGRGWRCCQPTLVGYALCEHHLGKGRVRSMSSVRQRHHEVDRCGAGQPTSSGDLGLQQPLVVTKRRTKVGVVKARSISSLLNQV